MLGTPASASGGANRRSYRHRSAEERLAVAQGIAEAYSTNAEVRAALATSGVTAARITALRALIDAARAEITTQTRTRAAALEATTRQNTAREAGEADYQAAVDRASAAFRKDTAARAALGYGGRKRKASERFAQMRQFYDNADAYAAALADYGVTPAMLTAGRASLEAAETATREADRHAAEAQDATDARERALDALDDAVRDLQERAKAALRDRPQLLELFARVIP